MAEESRNGGENRLFQEWTWPKQEMFSKNVNFIIIPWTRTGYGMWRRKLYFSFHNFSFQVLYLYFYTGNEWFSIYYIWNFRKYSEYSIIFKCVWGQ